MISRVIDRLACMVFGSPRFRKAILWGIALIIVWNGSDRWDAPAHTGAGLAPDLPAAEMSRIRRINQKSFLSLDPVSPKGVYIVIDTAKNRLYLKNGKKIVIEAVCSTGNGKILFDYDKKRQWVFDTPRGERHILKKVHRPVWTKPDWAFIEEGQKIPTSFRERVEEEMLGDFALHIGDGYMIHGTLYSRLLGRSVTHGCIRLGDADLEKVYKASPVGTPVFIF